MMTQVCRLYTADMLRRLLQAHALALVIALSAGPSICQEPSHASAGGNPGTLPDRLVPIFQAGVTAEKSGRLDDAKKSFLEVLHQGGKVAFVYNNLGTVYQQQRDHSQAIAQFREALRLQPDYVAPRILLGASLLALGKTVEATRELERAVQLAPRMSAARQELAKAYSKGGNWTGVVDQYVALRRQDAADPESAYQLGTAYLKLSGWCGQEVNRLAPKSARVYQIRAENHLAQGQLDQALMDLRNALAADPSQPGLHLSVAEIYVRQGKFGTATSELEEELKLVPESVAALALKKKLRTAGNGAPPR